MLVKKSRWRFEVHKPKAPLCKGSCRKATEGLFYGRILLFTIPPSRYASHLPLHKGGSLPPDSTPIRCDTLYLAGKACKKEYGQNCQYSFCFICFMEDTLSRSFLLYYHLLNSESSRPWLFSSAQFIAQVPGKISRLLPLTSTTLRVSPESVRFLGSQGHFSIYLI